MKIRLASAFAAGLLLAASVFAQAPDPNSNAAPPSGGQQAGGNGARGQRGGFGGGQGAMGRGVSGTVTEAAADHFTVKSFTGDTYTVKFTADTRMMKQAAGQRGMGGGFNREDGQGQGQAGGQQGGNRRQGQGRGFGGNPPQPIKAADIKVGDVIAAMGELDAAQKSVGATVIMQLDPERAKQMQEMEASYGKTWLIG